MITQWQGGQGGVTRGSPEIKLFNYVIIQYIDPPSPQKINALKRSSKIKWQGVECITVTSPLSFNNKFQTQLPISLMWSGDASWGYDSEFELDSQTRNSHPSSIIAVPSASFNSHGAGAHCPCYESPEVEPPWHCRGHVSVSHYPRYYRHNVVTSAMISR